MDSSFAPQPPDVPFSDSEKQQLLDIADRSIDHGLKQRKPLPVTPEAFPLPLREPRAVFVTLYHNTALRGCIGNLEAQDSLVEAVSRNAYAAAFQDPRFGPMTEAERPGLEIHLSILTKPQLMEIASEQDLLQQIRPGVDGLILEEQGKRGTFLPAVWDTLPQPVEFVEQLKRKAGLPPDYWSDTLRISRYQAIHVP